MREFRGQETLVWNKGFIWASCMLNYIRIMSSEVASLNQLLIKEDTILNDLWNNKRAWTVFYFQHSKQHQKLLVTTLNARSVSQKCNNSGQLRKNNTNSNKSYKHWRRSCWNKSGDSRRGWRFNEDDKRTRWLNLTQGLDKHDMRLILFFKATIIRYYSVSPYIKQAAPRDYVSFSIA